MTSSDNMEKLHSWLTEQAANSGLEDDLFAFFLSSAAAIRELQAENARTTRDRDEWKQAADNALCLAKSNFERAEAAEAEALEQARLNGMGSEREARLLTRVKEAAEAKLAELQAQKPVAWLQNRMVDSYLIPGSYETCSPTDYGAFAVYAKPVPAVDLAEFKREARALAEMIEVEARANERGEVFKESVDERYAALQSHLEKLDA